MGQDSCTGPPPWSGPQVSATCLWMDNTGAFDVVYNNDFQHTANALCPPCRCPHHNRPRHPPALTLPAMPGPISCQTTSDSQVRSQASGAMGQVSCTGPPPLSGPQVAATYF